MGVGGVWTLVLLPFTLAEYAGGFELCACTYYFACSAIRDGSVVFSFLQSAQAATAAVRRVSWLYTAVNGLTQGVPPAHTSAQANLLPKWPSKDMPSLTQRVAELVFSVNVLGRLSREEGLEVGEDLGHLPRMGTVCGFEPNQPPQLLWHCLWGTRGAPIRIAFSRILQACAQTCLHAHMHACAPPACACGSVHANARTRHAQHRTANAYTPTWKSMPACVLLSLPILTDSEFQLRLWGNGN